MPSNLTIGLPKKHTAKGQGTKCPPPSNDFLTGTWHVTHSSLPLWKNKRNVNITYTPLPPSTTSASGLTRMDDLVRYQTLNSDRIKSVHGIDTPAPGNAGAWDWRGKGWLGIASSHWECLGFGRVEDGNEWVVTYFAKTLFTPAGIDVYSREKGGLPDSTVQEILGALRGFGVDEVTALADSVFQIPQD